MNAGAVVGGFGASDQFTSVGPKSGAATAISIPQVSGGKRRVHTEGLKMLDNKYIVMEEKMKMQSIENRVKRLEFEE